MVTLLTAVVPSYTFAAPVALGVMSFWSTVMLPMKTGVPGKLLPVLT